MNRVQEAQITIPEWTADLVDAFETEARQLETLVGVLQHQREGIEQDELRPVQDSVSAIHRILLTLDEARKRRRTLLEMAQDRVAREGESAPLRVSRDRLLQAARGLENELSLNRRVLESALESTDQEIRLLLAQTDDATTYAEDETAAGAGRLVDRQV